MSVARIRRSRPAIAVISDIVQRPTIVATIANSRQVSNLFSTFNGLSAIFVLLLCLQFSLPHHTAPALSAVRDDCEKSNGILRSRTTVFINSRLRCVGRAYFIRNSARTQLKKHNFGDIMEKCQ